MKIILDCENCTSEYHGGVTPHCSIYFCDVHDAADDLLEALKADVHDMQEVRNLVEGLEGDKIEIQRLKDLLDGRLHFSGLAIERAEGKAQHHE